MDDLFWLAAILVLSVLALLLLRLLGSGEEGAGA